MTRKPGGLVRAWSRLETRVRRVLRAKSVTHPAYMHFMLRTPERALVRLEDQGALSAQMAACLTRHLTEGRAAETMRTASMWDAQEADRAELNRAIEAGDAHAMSTAFRSLFAGTALDGMSHGNSLFADEARSPYEKGYFGRRTLDCLLSLAEAVGTAPLPSYGQRRIEDYAAHLMADHGALLAATEDALGFSLEMPVAGGPMTIDIGGKMVAPDSLRHAYVAWRARQLVGQDAPVLEIGGGYGILALLAHRAGIRNWTIIDLPFVGCIQLGYLANALGENAVGRAGDAEHAITIAAPEAIHTLPDDGLGLVVNCDSLPEMGRETALAYVREIKRTAPLFLSINQEAGREHNGVPQNRVGELVETVGGFRRVYRFRHWMEQGYAEELYARI